MIQGTNDADELKTALVGRAEEFCSRLFPAGRRAGRNFVVGSLAGEEGKSLSICIAGSKSGVWKDFAGDAGGDNLVELLRAVRGGSFPDACQEARAWLGVSSPMAGVGRVSNGQAQPAKKAALRLYQLNDAETARGTRMAERLIADRRACESVAKRRDWRLETVLALAHEASLGLTEEDRLAFLYDTCVKQRWIEQGERQIRFVFGKADSLWRGGLLPIAQRVFILEGETDAISLVDAGVERDGNSLVVALPSASTIKPHWAKQLAGKDALLCMDADEAGSNAFGQLTDLLAPSVNSLQVLNLENLLQ